MMSRASHLWAVGYNDLRRADQVRAEIAQLGERHCLILLETAVAISYPDGRVTVDGKPFVAAITFRGHSLASFFAGLALGAPPLTGAAVDAYVEGTDSASAE